MKLLPSWFPSFTAWFKAFCLLLSCRFWFTVGLPAIQPSYHTDSDRVYSELAILIFLTWLIQLPVMTYIHHWSRMFSGKRSLPFNWLTPKFVSWREGLKSLVVLPFGLIPFFLIVGVTFDPSTWTDTHQTVFLIASVCATFAMASIYHLDNWTGNVFLAWKQRLKLQKKPKPIHDPIETELNQLKSQIQRNNKNS